MRITRAYARALQTEFLIFCCHKCHTSPEKGRGKSQNEALEKASFDDVENEARRLYSEYCYNVLFIRILLQNCDTCDSKNDKTPYTRVRVRIFAYYCTVVVVLVFPIVRKKTFRRFMKSDTLFYEK